MIPLADPVTEQARACLGVSALATAPEIRAAFRRAAKAAHPDRPGGETDYMQALVQARDLLLQRALLRGQTEASPASAPEAPDHLAIPLALPLDLALHGGPLDHSLPDGRPVRLNLPRGLRNQETLRLKARSPDGASVYLRVRIQCPEGLSVSGHDLWMELAVRPSLLRQGGRLELDTPHGPRTLVVVRASSPGLILRSEQDGLPATARHPAGHLFVRLLEGTEPVRPAHELLQSFARHWAAPLQDRVA